MVIVVIGILIAAIGLVGAKVSHGQKVNQTKMIMKNVRLAIDQFAEQNPLASIYDRLNRETGQRGTFGPYPPYQLENCGGTCVSGVLEPPALAPSPYTLAARWQRDLGGGQVGVALDPQRPPGDDDIRALYVYLKVFVPDGLGQIPGPALSPLVRTAEYVNPAGSGTTPGAPGLLDVLGIHDAWGVPLDYFLYVKLEHGLLPAGGTGWRVTERIPVLRSRGIKREVYETLRQSGQLATRADEWIFSDPLPAPAAQVNNANGALGTRPGWARARAAGEDYDYVPRQ